MGINKEFSKELTNKIKEVVKERMKTILKEAEIECKDIVDKSSKMTTRDLYEEAINMYDSLIEQYYRYKTEAYYRHDSGIGTGWGVNLYLGKNFYIDKNNDLNIEFSGKKMKKYKKDKYATRDEVLAIVKGGFRGVPGKWIMPWEGSFDGEYFSISDTNVDKAFDIFLKNYEYMYEEGMKKNIQMVIKHNKYKYF